MQELEKILQEIDCRFENLLITDDECRKTALSKHDYEKVKYYRTGIVFTERAMDIVKDIIIKHMSGKDIDVLANDGWVPVDEQLPEDDMDVLVTYADIDDEQYVDITITTYGYAYLGGRKLDFKEWRSPFEYFRSNYKVIAWQPLPEPYRPERSEGK